MQQLIAITTDCWSLGLKFLELGCGCTMKWDIQVGFAVLVTLVLGYGVMHQYPKACRPLKLAGFHDFSSSPYIGLRLRG